MPKQKLVDCPKCKYMKCSAKSSEKKDFIGYIFTVGCRRGYKFSYEARYCKMWRSGR